MFGKKYKTPIAFSTVSPEVDADAAELRAVGGEDREVGGLVVEVVAARAEVAAVEGLRGGRRSAENTIHVSICQE